MDGTLVHVPLTVTQFIQQSLHKLGISYPLHEVTKAWHKVDDQLWKGRLSDFTLHTHDALVESNRLILEQFTRQCFAYFMRRSFSHESICGGFCFRDHSMATRLASIRSS